MKIDVNLSRLNELAVTDIGKAVKTTSSWGEKYGPILTVRLPSGSTLIALPCSSINHLAPPYLSIKGKPDHRITNQTTARKIANALRPACKSKHLLEAVKIMKTAINIISRPEERTWP